MMLGVLGMTSGVLGLYEAGQDVHAVVELHCEQEPQCAQVERLVLKVRDEWAKMPALRDFGLGPVLDHLEVDHKDTKLRVRATAATTDVVMWAKLFLDSKPIVASASPASSASSGQLSMVPVAPGDLNPNVPTQTIHVTVPEGAKPGDPLSFQLPTPTPGTNGQVRSVTAVPAQAAGTPAGSQSLSATVPGGRAPSVNAGSKALTVTVPGPSRSSPP
jgi:hypothetical protein